MPNLRRDHYTTHQDISRDYTEYRLRRESNLGSSAVQSITQDQPHMQERLQYHFDRETEGIFDQERTEDVETERAEQVARAFIKNITGITVDAPVIWKANTKDDISGVSHSLSGLIESVDVKGWPGVGEMTSHYRYMANTANVIHEMMHHTGIGNRRILGVVDASNQNLVEPKLRYQYKSGLSLIDMRGYDHTQDPHVIGTFFEEACAEEASARWRESVEPIRRDYSADRTHELVDGLKLPWRYFDTAIVLGPDSVDEDIHQFGAGISSLCAETVRLMSEYSGVDLFEQMVASRDPKKQAAAKREIVQAIESIQPGLYKMLRDLSYTYEDFRKGYERVKALTERTHDSQGEQAA